MDAHQSERVAYKKLVWRCRRGNKELDIILKNFLENGYAQSDSKRQQAFRQLLEYSDPDIQDLLNGVVVSNDEVLNRLIGDMHGHD